VITSLPRGGILSFDSARRTGWAYAMPGEVPIWGSDFVAPQRGTMGEWIDPMFDWTMTMLDRYRPVAVGYMRAIKTPFDTIDRLEKLIGLTGAIAHACERRRKRDLDGLRIFPVEDSAVCRAFTGKGRWPGGSSHKKAAVIDVCRRYGWNVLGDDDAADALAVLVFLETRLYPKEAARRGVDRPYFQPSAKAVRR
jgi:hypothetical protein